MIRHVAVFALVAVLDTVEKRRVIKFANDEPLGRPDRWSHFYGTQGCTEAASYHVELAVPDGMRARTRTEFVGASTCTHLNDVLRALEDVEHLARSIDQEEAR